MSKIASSALSLVGGTPLVETQRVAADLQLKARVLVKLESFNPAGSVKDRAALAMVEAAEREGKLAPGATLVEATSGNTGVGLAFVAAIKGYKAIIVMPETMSIERRRLVAAYGAEVVLTPGAERIKGALAKAEEDKKALSAELAELKAQHTQRAADSLADSRDVMLVSTGADGKEFWRGGLLFDGGWREVKRAEVGEAGGKAICAEPMLQRKAVE